jgi:hypothetical protein
MLLAPVLHRLVPHDATGMTVVSTSLCWHGPVQVVRRRPYATTATESVTPLQARVAMWVPHLTNASPRCSGYWYHSNPPLYFNATLCEPVAIVIDGILVSYDLAPNDTLPVA